MVALIAAGFSTTVGCGSEKVGNPTAKPSSSVATATAPTECVEVPVWDYREDDEKKLTARLVQLALPAGACFFAVDTTDLAEQPGKISVRVDLTVPNSIGPEDLRAVATDIAHLVKKDEVAQRTAVLRVTNWGFAKPKYRDHLFDENFLLHPWDGSPSRQAEMALWKVFEQK
ncbi:hypothetical protein [Nocardia arthritidis]|uniref:hypothetical protein n=1 Tax=Nocardia arthritidis TaxID=228602 RepID=UPI0012ED6406|nr:hypothetical protein [Nocardia arthritidis]